jgi:hypothetical protein
MAVFMNTAVILKLNNMMVSLNLQYGGHGGNFEMCNMTDTARSSNLKYGGFVKLKYGGLFKF